MRSVNAVEQMVRAAADGDEKRVARLLGEGVPVDAGNTKYRTALDVAVWAQRTNVIRLLLAAGADPEQSIGEYAEDTPLRFAAARGMREVVSLLLDADAMPDYRLHPTRATPLMLAATENHTEIVRLLLDHGAALELEGRGKTALEWAAWSGRPEALRLLLDRGAVCTAEALECAEREAVLRRQSLSPERSAEYKLTVSILLNTPNRVVSWRRSDDHSPVTSASFPTGGAGQVSDGQ
jgi:ankyrin repeat protein